MDFKIIIGTFIRQNVTAFGAILVAKGLLPAALLTSFAESTTGLLVGVVALGGGYLWSLVSKKKALDTPVPKVGK